MVREATTPRDIPSAPCFSRCPSHQRSGKNYRNQWSNKMCTIRQGWPRLIPGQSLVIGELMELNVEEQLHHNWRKNHVVSCTPCNAGWSSCTFSFIATYPSVAFSYLNHPEGGNSDKPLRLRAVPKRTSFACTLDTPSILELRLS